MTNWRDAVMGYIRENARPADKYDHQPRLYALTKLVGEDLEYDDDVVFAAAWMHDLGVFIGHRPENLEELARWDNVAYACEKTPSVLESLGFPQEKIPRVIDAIRTHQAKASPPSVEGAILRDADILEQLGAVGVVRAMVKVGRDTRFATYRDVTPVLETTLQNLPGHLRLDRAKQLAIARVAALRAFLDALKTETDLPA